MVPVAAKVAIWAPFCFAQIITYRLITNSLIIPIVEMNQAAQTILMHNILCNKSRNNLRTYENAMQRKMTDLLPPMQQYIMRETKTNSLRTFI